MAPTSHVPASQAPMPYTLSSTTEHRSSGRKVIEPATGFSLLHTIQLGQSASTAASQTAKVAPTYSGCSVATGTAVITALPPATATPAARRAPRTLHVVQHCEQNLRQELGTITCRVFDIVASHRRVNDLRHINVGPIIHTAVLTLSRNTSLRGIALQPFHAGVSTDGKEVRFLGNCRVDPRIRAFTSTSCRGAAKTRPWTMTVFRVLQCLATALVNRLPTLRSVTLNLLIHALLLYTTVLAGAGVGHLLILLSSLRRRS